MKMENGQLGKEISNGRWRGLHFRNFLHTARILQKFFFFLKGLLFTVMLGTLQQAFSSHLLGSFLVLEVKNKKALGAFKDGEKGM